MADCAGHKHDKIMKDLIVNGIELMPSEHEQPEVKEDETINFFVVEKREMELKMHCDEMKPHEKNKAKTFVVIGGQCSVAMRTKTGSHKHCETVEEWDDVIKLIEVNWNIVTLILSVNFGVHWTLWQKCITWSKNQIVT